MASRKPRLTKAQAAIQAAVMEDLDRVLGTNRERKPRKGPGKSFWDETASKLQNLPQSDQDDFWRALWSSGIWYDTPLEATLRCHIERMLNTLPPGFPSSEERWYAPVWEANRRDYEAELEILELEEKWTKKGSKPNAERDARIVQMRDERKLTFGQIGSALGLSAVTAKKAYYRSKKRPKSVRFVAGSEPGTIRVVR